jgi:hypothetical protein
MSSEPEDPKPSLGPDFFGAVGCILGTICAPLSVFGLIGLANVIFHIPVDGQIGMFVMLFAPIGAVAGAIIGAWLFRLKR